MGKKAGVGRVSGARRARAQPLNYLVLNREIHFFFEPPPPPPPHTVYTGGGVGRCVCVCVRTYGEGGLYTGDKEEEEEGKEMATGLGYS